VSTKRRKHTYIATIWVYEWPHSHTRQPVEYNLGSNLDHARARARDLLPVKAVAGTRWTWEREVDRSTHVAMRQREIHTDDKGRITHVYVGRYEWFKPDVTIEPSVGELGYTP